MTRQHLFAAFFFAVFLFLLYQLYLMFEGFLAPMGWAALLAISRALRALGTVGACERSNMVRKGMRSPRPPIAAAGSPVCRVGLRARTVHGRRTTYSGLIGAEANRLRPSFWERNVEAS